MSLFARFRGKERDIETDVSRITPVLDMVLRALAEAHDELSGLILRSAAAAEVALAEKSHGISLARAEHLRCEIEALSEARELLEGIRRPAPYVANENPRV
jgi:hypothetical protein